MSYKPHKEIERKFLVKDLPGRLNQYFRNAVRQGYIVIGPDMKSSVRLRQSGKVFSETIKRGNGKIRDEFEIELTAEQFKKLWPTTEGRRIKKTRYFISLSRKTLFLDVFLGKLKGLIMVEVEFGTIKKCDAFVPLKWFGKEVTEDKRYTNQSLAMHGLP